MLNFPVLLCLQLRFLTEILAGDVEVFGQDFPPGDDAIQTFGGLRVFLVDGYYIAGGDIIVGKLGDKKLLSTRTAGFDWPCPIPYKNSLVVGRSRVDDAIEEFESYTSWRFVERTDQTDYIEVLDGSGCNSYIGRQGGMQEIFLKEWCTTGTVIHELGHAIGLFHEHQRFDRDDHIRILYENVKPGWEGNFDIISNDEGNPTTNYDYDSIMHYREDVFSWPPGAITIQPLIDIPGELGQRERLSSRDISGVENIYRTALHGCVEDEIECSDDVNWQSSYGNCASYGPGGSNDGYCQQDKNEAGDYASDACPTACELCFTKGYARIAAECSDDVNWQSLYGNCASYGPGGSNDGYCQQDTNEAGDYASDACPVACGLCFTEESPPASPPVSPPVSPHVSPPVPPPTSPPVPPPTSPQTPTNSPSPTYSPTTLDGCDISVSSAQPQSYSFIDINGDYDLSGEYNGLAYYHNEVNDMYLFYSDELGNWLFSDQLGDHESVAWAEYGNGFYVTDNSLNWNAWDLNGGDLVEASGIDVECRPSGGLRRS